MPQKVKNKKQRLTVGCRARILTLKEKPSPEHVSDSFDGGSSWCKDYGGREVLLTERSGGGDFAAMLLKEGTEKLRRSLRTVEDEMAWIPEEDLELVNYDFDTNLDFIDWYANKDT